jgi:Lamin Tail Domain
LNFDRVNKTRWNWTLKVVWSLGCVMTCVVGGQAFASISQSPKVTKGSIAITEIMYQSLNGDESEYLELTNPSDQAYSLLNLQFTVGISFTFPDVTLQPGQRVVVVENQTAFETVYGSSPEIVGVYTGVLSGRGEQVVLVDDLGNELIDLTYGTGRNWPEAADGFGHSLVLAQEDLDVDLLDYPGYWVASARMGGSPGTAEPTNENLLMINEIEPHTDTTIPGYDSNDRIEIYNAGNVAVDFADWYLSDDGLNLPQWALPSGSLAPGDLIYYDQVTGFDNPSGSGFAFSKLGEKVFLSYLPGNDEDRIADAVSFEATENGISFSRISDGDPWWAGTVPTPGAGNQTRLSDVLITEVMYHPDGDGFEYVEIYNPTASSVALENSAGTWKLDGGVDFELPTGATLASGEYLLFVPFDPADSAAIAAFELTYGSDASRRFVGPWVGALANEGERLSLVRPLIPHLDEPIEFVVVDEVYYFDKEPFPLSADGPGDSLNRVNRSESGNNPSAWQASSPTPGVGVSSLITTAWTVD